MKNNKGSTPTIILLVILVIIAVAGAFYFGKKSGNVTYSPTPNPVSYSPSPIPSPTPDQTANWKIYNEQYFSLKLPIGWNQSTNKNPIQFLNYVPSTTNGGDFDYIRDKGKLKIEIYQTNYGNSVREYLDLQKQEFLPSTWNETNIIVNGLPAIKVKTNNPGFVIYTESRGEVISISFLLDFDNYQDLSNQILSTFKFTN